MSLMSRLRLELRLLSAFAKLSSSAVLLTFRLMPLCGSVRDFPRRPLGAAWAAFSLMKVLRPSWVLWGGSAGDGR